ncbi:MAG TPA: phosphonate C-P lyase system protein PhnH [Bacillus sp. (in: firmicutes)]|nr:phosphonate C-P lyase system protein PhnH [Bacillus sp. (in: firmicutes)]
MAIDQVHDLQKVFRMILHSMSRPGTISSIETIMEKADYRIPCNQAIWLTIMTLLEAEVTFHLLSEHHQGLIRKISEHTQARYAPINEADYVIVLKDTDESAVLEAMECCKNGNLINPDQSSTWIIESSQLTNDGQLMLTGPGIKTMCKLQTCFTKSMWQAREKRTKEFPLGIDLIFADDDSQIVCVPRTTKTEMLEVK